MGLTPAEIAKLSPAVRKQIEDAIGKNPTKKSKYSNKSVEYQGIKFDSTKEKDRYINLIFYASKNIISDLRLQVRYKLEIEGHRVETYVADFVYFDTATQKEIVEDCKGFKTPAYRRKKKWMKKIFGIEIKET